MKIVPSRPSLSVAAPCFSEEAPAPEFVRRMVVAREAVAPEDDEVMLANDSSGDQTWQQYREALSGNR